MFTGITRGVYPIVAAEDHPGFTRFVVRLPPELARDVQNGASVAIDGVCCTVIAHDATDLTFEAVEETRKLTTLGELKVGRGVSVERSCRIGDELGGHDVSGHVVGTGEITRLGNIGEQLDVTIQVPAAWMKFILHKGFIAIDGSSLTVGEVRQAGAHGSFDIHLIPETLRLTNFGKKPVGARVNVELDPRTVAIVETVERVLAERAARGDL